MHLKVARESKIPESIGGFKVKLRYRKGISVKLQYKMFVLRERLILESNETLWAIAYSGANDDFLELEKKVDLLQCIARAWKRSCPGLSNQAYRLYRLFSKSLRLKLYYVEWLKSSVNLTELNVTRDVLNLC